jgi:hypothetical protein
MVRGIEVDRSRLGERRLELDSAVVTQLVDPGVRRGDRRLNTPRRFVAGS